MADSSKRRLRIGALVSHFWGFSFLTSALCGKLSKYFTVPFVWTDRPQLGGSNAQRRVWKHIELWDALSHEQKTDARQSCARQVRHKKPQDPAAPGYYDVEVKQATFRRSEKSGPDEPTILHDDKLLKEKTEEHEIDLWVSIIFGGIYDRHGDWMLDHPRIQGRVFNAHLFGWPLGGLARLPLFLPSGFEGATGDVAAIDAVVHNRSNFISIGIHQGTPEVDQGRLFACSDPIAVQMMPWSIPDVLTAEPKEQLEHMRSNFALMALAGSVQLGFERSLPYLAGALNTRPAWTRHREELPHWRQFLHDKSSA